MTTIARLFKKLLSEGHILTVAMIALTAVITHGLLISRLGYYHDDWYMLWSGVSRGAGSLVSLFSMDRPFMGWIYSKMFRVLGANMLGWHLVTLLLRIAGGVAFYWILNLAWPKLKNMFALAAMLFVVFPGFLSEPNAATKINHLIGYDAALFSIAFTLQSAKTCDRIWKIICTGLSLLGMALYLWIYEYMIGLEVMRLLLLFWMQWQGERNRAFAAVKKVILTYLPYVLVLGVFLYWRMFIFESTRSATDFKGLVSDYRTDFIGMALRLVFQVMNDFFSSSLFAWFVQPYHLFAGAAYQEIGLALLTAGGMVILTVGYLLAVRKAQFPDSEFLSPFVLVLIGAGIALAAVFPVVLSNRHLDLMDPYKSYGLHPSAGAVIIVIGLVAMLKPKYRNTLLVALLALSVATQSLNIQDWGNYWGIQRNFWWQLSWRAPSIADNTMVMALAPDGYGFQQDYEVWGPVNLVYHPDRESAPRIQSEVLNEDTLLEVLQGTQTTPYVRDIFLPRNYNNLLLLSQPTPQSCIHVIDGKMPAYSADERLIVEKVGERSNIGFIDPSAAPHTPPVAIFGKEPEHNWCYYYQQAGLARQLGDWRKISELYDTAQSAGFKPGDPSEYFVFVEGLVNSGRTPEAEKIANSAIKGNAALKYSLCESLTSAAKYPASYGYRRGDLIQVICQ